LSDPPGAGGSFTTFNKVSSCAPSSAYEHPAGPAERAGCKLSHEGILEIVHTSADLSEEGVNKSVFVVDRW
jgi:hypothetical protein